MVEDHTAVVVYMVRSLLLLLDYVHIVSLMFVIRIAANINSYGGALLTTSLFQHDEHCGVCVCVYVCVHVCVCVCVGGGGVCACLSSIA